MYITSMFNVLVASRMHLVIIIALFAYKRKIFMSVKAMQCIRIRPITE